MKDVDIAPLLISKESSKVELATKVGAHSGSIGAAQVELNKKREAEVNELRKNVENATIQQESTLANLKRSREKPLLKRLSRLML